MSVCFKMDKSEQILVQSENNEMIIDEDCEVTAIEEATTTDGVLNKSRIRKSVVWWYFNKLPGEEGSRCTLCGHVLRDCSNTTNLFKVNSYKFCT